ncbi:MAG: glycosyltransferase, partial [Planctomycetes bacterium]|nr:glycosyltransferase [Planctomycetota bacterium]
IGFGAESLLHRRKGFHFLLEALKRLRNTHAVLGLTFGNGVVPVDQGLPEIRSIGFISNPERQATVYSASDIFVMPSLEDNLPQTGVEALACGTPVIAFDTGGIPDYVKPMETGLLARLADTEDLTARISWLADRPEQRTRMGEEGRKLIVREFHHETQAAKYIDLYRRLLKGQDSRSIQAA